MSIVNIINLLFTVTNLISFSLRLDSCTLYNYNSLPTLNISFFVNPVYPYYE